MLVRMRRWGSYVAARNVQGISSPGEDVNMVVEIRQRKYI